MWRIVILVSDSVRIFCFVFIFSLSESEQNFEYPHTPSVMHACSVVSNTTEAKFRSSSSTLSSA